MSDLSPGVALSEAENASRMVRFPLGSTLSLDDMSSPRADALFDEIRNSEPVSWIPSLGGWLVTSYDLARTLLLPRDDVTVLSEQNMVRASLGRMMLTVDRDEHARQRKPFEVVFRPREVEKRFGDYLEDRARRLVDDLIGEEEFDVVARFASPYAIETAGHIVGLDLGDVARIDGFYADFAGAMVYDGDPEPLTRATRAREQLDELLRSSLSTASYDASLASSVLRDEENELSEDELLAQLRVIMFGAIETIQASVSNTLLLLLTHENSWERVVADEDLVGGAVSESLRLIPPVTFVERWAGVDLELADVAIAKGEFVGVSILAANHDGAIFERPHEFDMDRDHAQRALSFSFGEHHCLGYHLARRETVVAVREVLRRLADVSLAGYAEPEGFAFRRPANLRLRRNV